VPDNSSGRTGLSATTLTHFVGIQCNMVQKNTFGGAQHEALNQNKLLSEKQRWGWWTKSPTMALQDHPHFQQGAQKASYWHMMVSTYFCHLWTSAEEGPQELI